MKILTFSYDDGTTQDIRLAQLFHKYGMKATFNLNSGLFGRKKELIRCDVLIHWDQVNAADVKHIYEGHEVAAHTITHPHLTDISDEEIVHQVEDDRLALSELCGYEVVGMAYPMDEIREEYVTAPEKISYRKLAEKLALKLQYSGTKKVTYI